MPKSLKKKERRRQSNSRSVILDSMLGSPIYSLLLHRSHRRPKDIFVGSVALVRSGISANRSDMMGKGVSSTETNRKTVLLQDKVCQQVQEGSMRKNGSDNRTSQRRKNECTMIMVANAKRLGNGIA